MLIILIAILMIFPIAGVSKQETERQKFQIENISCKREGKGIYTCKLDNAEEVKKHD